MGCLALLGVVMLSVSCLAFFGWTGAITADPGGPAAAPAAPGTPLATAPTEAPRRNLEDVATRPGTPGPRPTAPVGAAAATRPAGPTAPAATRPASAASPAAKATGTTSESSIAQRLDREAVGGGLKVKTLGAAKTTQGDRAVLAIYIRLENDGDEVLRVDPATFKLTDRAGNRYLVTRGVDQMFPPVELRPRTAPGRQGELTEGNLTFEIPRTAQGLALLYELTGGGQPLRIPLPPEFG
jgi:hypothetical protein